MVKFLTLAFFLVCCIVVNGLTSDTSSANGAPPHKFSICTMVQNEGRYIEEWVAYHLLLKVDHFYIYNDRSSDHIEKVLEPYINQGFVSLYYWDNNVTVSPSLVSESPSFTREQRFALADCVMNHRDQTEWFGIWDVDEFLTLSANYPDVPTFLSNYQIPSNLDEFHIPMTIFGSSNHTNIPDGLVIENYVWRNNRTVFGTHPETNKFTGKSFYKSECAVPEVHWSPHLPAGCRPHFQWPSFQGESDFPIALNHYFSKSWEDFKAKMGKWHWSADQAQFESSMGAYSQVHDTKLWRYVTPIKTLHACIREKQDCIY